MSWVQSDERIKPVPLNRYPWSPLPPPRDATAKVTVSLIQTSKIDSPLNAFTPDAKSGDRLTVPAFSFLIEHGQDAILWDLGLRADPENFTPYARDVLCKTFRPTALREGPIAQLKANGFDLSRLQLVALSHKHFDRDGDLDTLPSIDIPILVGHGTLASVSPGYPKNPTQEWPSSWLDECTFLELPDPHEGQDEVSSGEHPRVIGPGPHSYSPVGPFQHGVDWFDDGSLWFVDAPGHCEGHIMALCRVTTSPPTYILLAGDAAHHQDVYLPVPASPEEDLRLPKPVVDGVVQMAVDPEVATFTIGQLTRMSAEPNVMVLLAHEQQAEGVLPEYPHGTLDEWKAKGWKEAKERETVERAKKRENGRTANNGTAI